jgi:hypothetical protein
MLPSVAIAAFAQSQIEGRRVIIFGSAHNCLWEKVLERGARLVHVCDPDSVRLAAAAARNTSPAVSFAPLSSQASLAVRDAAFDLGIVDNLAALGDAPSILRRLRRALSPRGLAFVTAPNPDIREMLVPEVTPSKTPLDYYSLYDAVRAEFPIVRMLGQMPFVGYTLAELAPLDNPEPSLDAGYVPGGTEEPEWFVAAASAHPFEIDSFTIVQIPVAEVLHHSLERQLREQLRNSRSAERSAVERLARLEAQQQVMERTAGDRVNADLAGQLNVLREELVRKESWIAALEARASVADARSDEAEHQLEQAHQKLSHAEGDESRAARLQQELTEVRARADVAEQLSADANSDLSRLETQLRERGERLRELQAELRSVTLVGEQLIRELQAAQDVQNQRFGLQTWSNSAQLEASRDTASTDTAQSPEQTSAWVSHQVECESPGHSIGHESHWQSLEDDRARLRADILAATWRIDQLLLVIEKSKDSQQEAILLRNQLSLAEHRLNEQSVLLRQLRIDPIRS